MRFFSSQKESFFLNLQDSLGKKTIDAKKNSLKYEPFHLLSNLQSCEANLIFACPPLLTLIAFTFCKYIEQLENNMV